MLTRRSILGSMTAPPALASRPVCANALAVEAPPRIKQTVIPTIQHGSDLDDNLTGILLVLLFVMAQAWHALRIPGTVSSSARHMWELCTTLSKDAENELSNYNICCW